VEAFLKQCMPLLDFSFRKHRVRSESREQSHALKSCTKAMSGVIPGLGLRIGAVLLAHLLDHCSTLHHFN
jgi:hypothetical protein